MGFIQCETQLVQPVDSQMISHEISGWIGEHGGDVSGSYQVNGSQQKFMKESAECFSRLCAEQADADTQQLGVASCDPAQQVKESLST